MKELRLERGLTQARFAQMVNVGRTSYIDIEHGNRGFSIDLLDRIIRGFDISYTEFFTGIDGKDHQP